MYAHRYTIPQVSTKGLALHYKMWDGFASSSETFDYALNGSLGTGAGTVAMENPGYGFTEGVINAGSDSSIDNIFDSGGSFSVWLSPESQGPTNDGRIIDKSTNGTVGWRLYCDGSNTKLTLLVVTGTTNGEWTFPIDMIGDVWQHVILTYDADASANNPVVYVNGASIAVTETGTPDDTRTSDAGATLYLASEASGGNYYDGSMDDLMFFGRVLGAAEAKSIYEVTRQRYGV